jgi:hypothetical protein
MGTTVGNKFIGAAWGCRRFTPTTRLILVNLAWRANDDSGEAWPGWDRIAGDCGCDRATACGSLKELGAERVFQAQKGLRKSTTYFLSLDRLLEIQREDAGVANGNGCETQPVGLPITTPEVADGNPNYTERKENECSECNSTPDSPVSISTAEQLADHLHSILDEPAKFDRTRWAESFTKLLIHNNEPLIRNYMDWAYNSGPNVAFWQRCTHNAENFKKHFLSIGEQMQRGAKSAVRRATREKQAPPKDGKKRFEYEKHGGFLQKKAAGGKESK